MLDNNDKIKINSDLVVITNTSCNMSCSNCILLPHKNGEEFVWDKIEERMVAWSKFLEVESIAIAGGEMFLHPNLDQWFLGLRKLWPNAHIEVPTNGTLITDRLDLSRLICNDPRATLRVSSLHKNTEKWLEIKDKISIVLEPWLDNLRILEEDSSIFYCVEDRVLVRFDNIKHFVQPYYQKVVKNTVHFKMNGDQNKSFKICPWHTDFILQDGLLYHCPATANYAKTAFTTFLPEVIESFNNFKPVDPLDGFEIVKQYVENGKNQSIEVCKHCAYDQQEIEKIYNSELKQL